MDVFSDGEIPVILFKYGGNAMLDLDVQQKVLSNICSLKNSGFEVVLVHGGGPFIKELLKEVKVESEFIDGHRKTSPRALTYVEMALKGKVNGSLVRMINKLGFKAVGLSGKDGATVSAAKRYHLQKGPEGEIDIDLGQVGDVASIDPTLVHLLLKSDYIPVFTCIASDGEGNDFNINADMFAGHLAAALKASQYVVLTDVPGLLRDKDDPSTLVKHSDLKGLKDLIEGGIVQGGMIPKVESCEIALKGGAQKARLINGTRPEEILSITRTPGAGTIITHS